ncbi:MAG: indolepyruvate ferredoxin oxidoreductase [Magnetococcales bacterium]|nr:indolepyruvate ferredoxin oxidoreductase [Magnetococcales bacterium]
MTSADRITQPVTLNDKYTLEEGRIFVSGSQALVRLPILQKEADTARGLNTSGFISGYRGSPLAGLDKQLWSAKKHLESHDIKFTPGINEDLGATAVWGSQQTHLFPDAKFDGTFALWYGKGPGVDRSMDAIKHANAAGTSANGGVLALLGDDHDCVSSTLGHQSEHDMISAMVPVLYPATVQEYLDYGLIGFGMSRYAGCWVGLKCATEIVESSASVEVSPTRIQLKEPKKDSRPEGGLHIRMPDPPLEQEQRLEAKVAAAVAYAKANGVDKFITNPKKATLGIITSGKSYKDVMQSLDDLGLSVKDAEKLGIRIYKVGLVWPLENEGVLEFAKGLKEILVVEEKREMIEHQLKTLLYGQKDQPRLVGKHDDKGEVLLPFAGGHTPALVALAMAKRIAATCGKNATTKAVAERAKYIQALQDQAEKFADTVTRLPYYCAGCPHNTSTKVPDGSRAVAGIGCHYMVQWMNRSSNIITHMGGEGVNWVGHAPFTNEKHVFANLGDGTYYHSGSLAVRQSVAAGVNITYKILYNDAVAMTGGQPVEGPMSVARITQQMAAEGVKKLYLVSDEPEKHVGDKQIATGTLIRHRRELDDIQRELRETPGTTVIIYDQTCAAEKRRRRKRGTFPDPAKRAFINELVCEGCGDCSVKSNCVAVEPLETEFGRKRKINQSSCNKDYSCVEGFCPSFVTVHGGDLRKLEQQKTGDDTFAGLPDPKLPILDKPYNMLITGIGGTGVITIGAVLGMAAHIEGKGVTVLDQTGLAQKNGSVMSHLRIAKTPDDLHAVRIATGNTDLLLGCDVVVSAGKVALSRYSEKTTAIVNSHLTPTAAFTLDPDTKFHESEQMLKIKNTVGKNEADFIEATALATDLMGDAIATNMFMMGYAWQKGLIPLSFAAIEEAVKLNGVAVQDNLKAFAWGRLGAHNPAKVKDVLKARKQPEALSDTVEEIIQKRVAYLTDYQNAKYAEKYQKLVAKAQKAEAKLGKDTELTEAVARYAFKLMAYKDEYEVARLYTSGEFKQKLKQTFAGNYKLKFHMAPPLLARKNSKGHLVKQEFGGWVYPAFKVLAKLKGLRGTAFDIFGYTAERKTERQLIKDYKHMVKHLVKNLDAENHHLAVALARIPEEIRGFGHVKENHLAKAKVKEAQILAAFNDPTQRTNLELMPTIGHSLGSDDTAATKVKIVMS